MAREWIDNNRMEPSLSIEKVTEIPSCSFTRSVLTIVQYTDVPRSWYNSRHSVHRHTRLSLSAAHCPSGGDMNTFPLPHTHSWYTLGSLSSTPLFFAPFPLSNPLLMVLCWPLNLFPVDATGIEAELVDVLTVFRPLKNTLAASICIYIYIHVKHRES